MIQNNLDLVLQALGNSNRRRILALLRTRNRTVGEIAGEVGLSQPGISKHLGVLERSHLIRRIKRSQKSVCVLQPEGFLALEDWLNDYRVLWDGALDRLDSAIKSEQNEKG